MTQGGGRTFDVIGVGFGPSNLALAIALQELAARERCTLNTLFLEKQADYRWHGETLVGQSALQISFLKDLVSLRNPTSPYSFVNYLHRQGRLVDFINRGTFYPCRMEFNDYLRWVAEHFAAQARYGEEVLAIEPCYSGGIIDRLRLRCRDRGGHEHARFTRAVVVATGGTPKIPPVFAALGADARIFHHSRYLAGIEHLASPPQRPLRVAIVGGGQSAAEAFIDINDRLPAACIEMILRGSALKPADDSPFVNEIFAPGYTDLVFAQHTAERARLIEEYHNTNYSVVDLDLIERIHDVLYRQKVARHARHGVLCRRRIEAAATTPEAIELILRDAATDRTQVHRYDAVILATGYERRSHRDLLAPLQEHLQEFTVNRDYRVPGSRELKAGVYLQGFCEATHGLSDTLLSVLPLRAEEIGTALYRSLAHTQRALDEPVARAGT